jgi:hypothetical protein
MPEAKKTNKKITKKKVVTPATKRTSASRAKKTTKNKRSTTKKLPMKQSAKKSSRPVQNKKSGTTKESVQLPTNAGVRLQKKTEAARDFISLIHEPMYRITYVTAFCFLAVGLFGLITVYSVPTPQQLASTCLTGICDPSLGEEEDDSISAPTVNSDLADVFNQPGMVTPPELSYIEPLPNQLSERVQVSLRVQYTVAVEVSLISQVTGEHVAVPVSSLSNENYRFWLDPSVLNPGQYRLTVTLRNQSGIYEHIGGSFSVPTPEVVEPIGNQSSEDETQNDEIVTDSTGTPSPIATTASQPPTVETDTNPETTLIPESVNESKPEITPFEEDTPFEAEHANPIYAESTFEFLEVTEVWVGREIISLQAPNSSTRVQVYVRPVNSLQALFLGTASRQQDRWVYTFDSRNYGNGQYELFAVADTPEAQVTSPSEIIRIENIIEQAISPQTQSQVKEVEGELSPVRDFYQVDTTASVDSNDALETGYEIIANSLIQDNAELINDLMKRYATAQQSEQQLFLEVAEKNLSTEQARLLDEIIHDSETQENLIQIELLVQERLRVIKERVDTFEDLRRARLAETASQDSDGDGISDIDEVTVYKTDPNNPDSDGDTFLDGVEIVSGFDPNDSQAETVINYELPNEVVGVTRSDVLSVEAVTPVVLQDDAGEVVNTFATINGRGLPNSFVTLYVFSSPIIVTVKTEFDGTFSYRFEKELDDGEHTVYVAFTDNAGAIMAQSEPYRFVKEAQAFSPGASTESGPMPTAPTVVESSTINSVQFVLSITLVVLGFFLFLLGITMRETKLEEAPITEPAV